MEMRQTILLVCIFIVCCVAKDKNYNVFVLERGKILREQTIINSEKNYERYIVPAHFELDSVDVLLDFNRGLSIKYFPDKHMCVVAKLDRKDHPSPSTLQKNLEGKKGVLWEKEPLLNQTYVIAGRFYDGLVTDDMRSHCKDAPIKWIEKSQTQTHGELVTKEQNGVTFYRKESAGQKSRTKRQFIDFGSCSENDKRDACIVFSHDCYHVITCQPTNTGTGLNDEVDCRDRHRTGTITCCTMCCLSRSGVSGLRTFCGDLKTAADVRQHGNC